VNHVRQSDPPGQGEQMQTQEKGGPRPRQRSVAAGERNQDHHRPAQIGKEYQSVLEHEGRARKVASEVERVLVNIGEVEEQAQQKEGPQ